jgi:hypothetical protein
MSVQEHDVNKSSIFGNFHRRKKVSVHDKGKTYMLAFGCIDFVVKCKFCMPLHESARALREQIIYLC